MMYFGVLILVVAGLFFSIGATVAILVSVFIILATLLLFGVMRLMEPETRFEKVLAAECMSVLLTVVLTVIGGVLYVVAMDVEVSMNQLDMFINELGVWAYTPILLLLGSMVYWIMHYVDTTFLQTVGMVLMTFALYIVVALVSFFVVLFCVSESQLNEVYEGIKEAIVCEYTEKYRQPQAQEVR